MFERFTRSARDVVLRAAEEAEQEPLITEEHLALALTADPGSAAGRVITEHEITRARLVAAFDAARRRGGLSDADALALRSIGIDVGDVVDKTETSLGAGALATKPRRRNGILTKVLSGRKYPPFSRGSKRVLEGTLREATDLRQRRISELHILLALLKSNTLIAETFGKHGITQHTVRADLGRTG